MSPTDKVDFGRYGESVRDVLPQPKTPKPKQQELPLTTHTNPGMALCWLIPLDVVPETLDDLTKVRCVEFDSRHDGSDFDIRLTTINSQPTYKLPPGPKGVPFFGNLFQLSTRPWKEFETWKDQYGPIMYITAAGQKMLVLNTHQAAADLLDRRGHIYSDRPRFILASEIFTRGLLLVIVKYGGFWRKLRRAGQKALHKMRVAEFHPVQSKEAILLTEGLLRNSSVWVDELRRASASTVLSVVYDLPTVATNEDPTVMTVDRFNDAVLDFASTGHYFVEFFPWLKHVPSLVARWKREAEEGHERYSAFFESLFRGVQRRINEGDERPSFAGSLIRERHRHHLNDKEAAWLTGSVYAAGAETTATVMMWFMLAMIASPDKQNKCQEELDRVVGRFRMPTLRDRDSLPYLRATVRELLRWRSVAPLGAQHCTTEDDWYQGFFIPKGTICMANVWCMNRDKAIYGDDADDFNPDRFIDERGQLSPALADTKDEGHVTYGFGLRICLGRHMANDSLFINIACILWAANISAVKDETGQPIIPDTLETVNSGVVVRPLPFDCVITPRFQEATAIVAQARELL